MHQKEYKKEEEVAEINQPTQKDRKLLPNETQQLRRVTRQLNWESTQTKLDMAYAGSVVSSSIKYTTVRDLITANKFIKLLKSNKVDLSFPQMNDFTPCSSVSIVNFEQVNAGWV